MISSHALMLLDHLAGFWLMPRPGVSLHCVEAAHAIAAKRFHLITTPDGDPYLLRMWLTPPAKGSIGHEWESGNSSLLHWILQPDADRHLHDHPWEFTTRLVAGGYIQESEHGFQTFPAGSSNTLRLGTPHRIHALLDGPGDLHTGLGGCWTRVTTGPRLRPWGFYVGSQWIDHADYLSPTLDLAPQPAPSSPDASPSGA